MAKTVWMKAQTAQTRHKYRLKASLFKASHQQTNNSPPPKSNSFLLLHLQPLARSILSIPMDSAEHLCYVRCNFCNTVLAVGVPLKRIMETVTVKCGHCNNISFLTSRPLMPATLPDFHMTLGLQTSCHDFRKGQPSSPTSSVENLAEIAPKVHHVVKPPERKHRVPSAYNRFMKEEIQRIKSAQPNIPHREAFSMAAKNWAKSDTNTPNGSQKSPKAAAAAAISLHEKSKNSDAVKC